MQRLVTGMTTNKGFTLIELLVVIVIIGITVGFALVSFGDFGERRALLVAAERLENIFKLAQQQAILESSTFGLKINKDSYQILKFTNKSQWIPLANKGIFKMNYLPKKTTLTLKTTVNVPDGLPAVVINSSGDITPFTLSFSFNNERPLAVITGKENGDLEWRKDTLK